jgi:hypothetical protein
VGKAVNAAEGRRAINRRHGRQGKERRGEGDAKFVKHAVSFGAPAPRGSDPRARCGTALEGDVVERHCMPETVGEGRRAIDGRYGREGHDHRCQGDAELVHRASPFRFGTGRIVGPDRSYGEVVVVVSAGDKVSVREPTG